LITLSWVGNIVYFSYNQLKKPVILLHYTDYSIYPEQPAEFELYYLTNRNENIEIKRIELPNMPLFAQVRNDEMNTYNSIVLKRAVVNMDRPKFEYITSNGDFNLEELAVYFSDGSMQNLNIGEIYLRNKRVPLGEVALKSVASGSSNGNQGFHLLTVEKPVIIESIEYPFRDKLGEAFQVSVTSSTDTWEERRSSIEEVNQASMNVDENALLETLRFPIRLEKGNTLRIAYEFQFDKADQRQYDWYKLQMKINFVKEDGLKETIEVEMHNTPEFQNRNFLEFAKQRRWE
jgi:hypothetical protein